MTQLFNEIKNLDDFQKSESEMIIELSNIDKLKEVFDNFSAFLNTKFTGTNKTYNEEISSYINDISSSAYYIDAIVKIISKKIDSYPMNKKRYQQIYNFLSLILSKSGTNVYEDFANIKLTNYWFWDWNWMKLLVNNNGFNLFQKLMKL